MTAIDLKAIRERDARYRAHIKCDWGTVEDDRCALLGLVDRMTGYLAHAPLCKAHLPIPRCDCGLDEIKKEVRG